MTGKRRDVHRARIETRRVSEREARRCRHPLGERTVGAVRRDFVDEPDDIQRGVDVAGPVDGHAIRFDPGAVTQLRSSSARRRTAGSASRPIARSVAEDPHLLESPHRSLRSADELVGEAGRFREQITDGAGKDDLLRGA